MPDRHLRPAGRVRYFALPSNVDSRMHDLHRAMDEISAIRGQIARTTEFRGYGPVAHAITGCLALAAASVQALWLAQPLAHVEAYLGIWIATALLAVVVIGIETCVRSVRLHRSLAGAMLHAAIEQFLPAIAAGGLLTLVLLRFAPASAWLLPGLWQLLFSLGVFASVRFLPRAMFAVGVWYLTTALVSIALGRESLALAPWLMGIPFGAGQLLVAAVLYWSDRDAGG